MVVAIAVEDDGREEILGQLVQALVTPGALIASTLGVL